MKKINLFYVLLLLFIVSLLPTNLNKNVFAEIKCKSPNDCPEGYKNCEPKEWVLDDISGMANDCNYVDCYCYDHARSIYKDGSEIISNTAEPLIEKVTTTTENPINLDPQTDLAIKITSIVKYSVGIGGLIAFILIVAGGLQIILSAGSPERVKAGKEMITSAIAGLLLIIFSIFILKLIGYDILNLPGFGYMSWGNIIN